jgi:hypothetical protein
MSKIKLKLKTNTLNNMKTIEINEMNKIILDMEDNIKTKITKINVARYNKSDILCLKRISRDKRIYIEYKHFLELCENNMEIILLLDKQMINGLVILIINYDIFNIIDDLNNINKFIFERIGSDNNISSVIFIKRYSEKNLNIDELLDKFNILKEKYKWKPLNKIKNDNSGNDKWNGHYAINTKGCVQNGIEEGCIQLANNVNDYCSDQMCEIVKYLMIYYMFHCKNPEFLLKSNDINKIEKYKEIFTRYISLININIINKNVIGDNLLKCGISNSIISSSDFLDKIELCHIIPVEKFKIKYDNTYNIISSFNYNNLLWGFRNANLTQSNNSLIETEKYIFDTAINLCKKYIDNDEEDNKDTYIELISLINKVIDIKIFS